MSRQSPSVSDQLKQGVYSSIGCLGVIVFALLLLVLVFGANRNSPPVSVPLPVTQSPYRYEVIERTDISYKSTPRMKVSVQLETADLPTKDRMIDTATKIWMDGNRHWKEFTVFMIGGGIRDFKCGAYGIAEFTPAGLKEFKINDVPLKMMKMEAEGLFKDLPNQSQPTITNP
jgi:hypothetical protein